MTKIIIILAIIAVILIAISVIIAQIKRRVKIKQSNKKVIKQYEFEEELRQNEEKYNKKIKEASTISDLANIVDDIMQNSTNRIKKL